MLIIIFGWLLILIALSFHWIAGVVVAAICLLLVMLPIEGFQQRQVDTLKLIKLKRGANDHTYYVEVCSKNKVVFAYDNSDMYNLNGGAYEEDFRKGKIKVYESRTCNEAVLKTYITKPYREIFTVAPFSTKIEYVFYVPEGTVINGKDKHPYNIGVEVV